VPARPTAAMEGSLAARVLVAYATKLGSTREISETIAGLLTGAGFPSEARSVRDVRTLDEWDAVVLGSALYAAHWQRDANRFVVRHRAALTLLPLWLFSSGPLDARLAGANLPITEHAAEITVGLGALEHRTFGGRLLADAPVDPQVLKTHPIGDFRNWAQVHDWALAIARQLGDLPARAEPGGGG
jgi:menaquinone-dependent protoporphyrinogen oxidase